MTTTVSAYAATSATAPLTKTTIERREVGAHDVAFDIHFAGICHSDIHQAREEWGQAIFPMVPGHEIAGVVREVGTDVTRYQVGDRVGVGCFVDSCRECENCKAGEEQYCLRGEVATYNGTGYDATSPARQYCSSPALQFAHSRQESTKQPTPTWSPTLYLVTSEPTAVTTPAIS